MSVLFFFQNIRSHTVWSMSVPVTLKISGTLSKSDPQEKGVLIVGQMKHLSTIKYEDVSCKFESRVSEEVRYYQNAGLFFINLGRWPIPLELGILTRKISKLGFFGQFFYHSLKPFYSISVISKYLPFWYNHWLYQFVNSITILLKETFNLFFFTCNWEFFFQNWEKNILFAIRNIAQ